MIEVRDVGFSGEFDPGDGVVTRFNEGIGIFYTHGFVLNGAYLVGELRFMKDSGGSYHLTSLEQHDAVPEEVYGSYRQLGRGEDICRHLLNGFTPSWQLATIDDVICVLRGRDTFRYNRGRCKFERRLSEEFPNVRFGEIGSSNVGLNSNESDIDIFIYDGYDGVIDRLRADLGGFGLVSDEQLFRRAMERHQTQYDLSREEAERICSFKLEGIVFESRRAGFFDASNNSVFRWVLQPNCSEHASMTGEVVDASLGGHHVVSYDIEGDRRYSIVLVRGIFKREKRHIVKNGTLVDVSGTLVHRNPDVIIVEDLRMLK